MQNQIGKVSLLIVIMAMGVASAQVGSVQADATAQTLPFLQDWSNTGLITANDDWSGVLGINGYLGQSLTTTTGVDPQTVLTESAAANDLTVLANQTNANITNGDVAEFDNALQVIALQGSGTADAPYILITVSTTGLTDITISYDLRDIDGSADNAIQPVALQYRVGDSGPFTNVAAGYVADATAGPSLATLVTPVNVTLPAAVDYQPLVQIRIITTNAVGSDEWIGIDDISITGTDTTPPSLTLPGNLTYEANTLGGRVVGFSASAIDVVDGSVPVTCTPSSDSLFMVGSTTVNCSAADVAGNIANGSFIITITDTTPPSLTLPGNMTVPQTIPAGAVVTFTATATDTVGPASPTVTCAPVSGFTFPAGATTVKCLASDTAGNIAVGNFKVTVRKNRNLLSKPDFSGPYAMPYSWNVMGAPAPFASVLDCVIFNSASCSVRLAGDKTNTYKSVFQLVKRSGLAGDKYAFGISSGARHAPNTGGLYQVEVIFYDTWAKVPGTAKLNLTPGTHGFQNFSGVATAPADYTHLVFRFVFRNASGQAWFDDAFLIKLP
ncbi:MAG: HYR domain-containing protein [Candidatus Auribacter fodinae]|uniref:HYR domain-containing protein n=1 Tax=Candidatus Auribacter fodinae TaxID=2093366 RepID=A0A3A4R516_9BACT|nr:MAG: HYR domain-containing protein [Candidatus Auribacter fodinae]